MQVSPPWYLVRRVNQMRVKDCTIVVLVGAGTRTCPYNIDRNLLPSKANKN